MFSDESQIQVRRRALIVLQDVVRRVVEAARDLPNAFDAMVSQDTLKMKSVNDRIRQAEEDTETLRRSLTRELVGIGAMAINREDLLRATFLIEEIAGYISATAFRFSQFRKTFFDDCGLVDDLRELTEMAVESIQRINEVVRALSISPSTAIDIANTAQREERKTDEKYRAIITKVLSGTYPINDLILVKDTAQGLEDLTDRCLTVMDTITILALGF